MNITCAKMRFSTADSKSEGRSDRNPTNPEIVVVSVAVPSSPSTSPSSSWSSDTKDESLEEGLFCDVHSTDELICFPKYRGKCSSELNSQSLSHSDEYHLPLTQTFFSHFAMSTRNAIFNQTKLKNVRN